MEAGLRGHQHALLEDAMTGRRVALFGGSFDPPHIGHQLVVAYLLGAAGFDQVWVIPTYRHALGKNLIEFEHRFQMCEAMVSIFPGRAFASRVEEIIALNDPKYVDSRTVNLVRHVKLINPQYDYQTVIGSDLIEQAQTWDEWDVVKRLAPPYVVGRLGYGGQKFALPNVSSTEIKKTLDQGSLALVPELVGWYIINNKLYRSE